MLFQEGKSQIFYEAWGDPKDRPVLFFHGFPGSHVQASGLGAQAKRYGIFLIACDRPGYGGSVFPISNLKSIFNFLDMLHRLLRHHEIQSFDIIGVSGGAPWAHLMASRFPREVRSLQIVCGLATYNNDTRKYFTAFQKRALLLRKILPFIATDKLITPILKKFNLNDRIQSILSYLEPVDREALQTPERKQMLMDSLTQARLQGAKGIAMDSALYHRDWLRQDCDLRKLNAIPTNYFHGGRDNILNYQMSEWMHKANPNSEYFFFEADGHYSLPLLRFDFIMEKLKAR